MPDFLKNQDGRYITDGLSSKDFTRVFELIRKEQPQTPPKRTGHSRRAGLGINQPKTFLSWGKERRHVLYA